jgi:hypothetical protein
MVAKCKIESAWLKNFVILFFFITISYNLNPKLDQTLSLHVVFEPCATYSACNSVFSLHCSKIYILIGDC